jgi:hypothetical protein
MGLRNVQDLFISNKTVISPREKVLVSATAATGTINFDCTSNSVVYYTSNASGNWTLNLRGNANNTFNSVTRIGETFTVVFMVTNGASAFYPTGFQIDGTTVTLRWFGGAAPTAGNINSIDAYTYNIVKTASATYTAFASQSRFA